MPCQPFCSSRNTTEGVAKNAASCWAFQQNEHPLAGGPKRTGLPQKFACERVCWYSVSVWLFLFDWDFGGYQGQDWTSSYSSYGVWKWGKKTKKPLIIIFPIDMAIKVGCFIDVHRFIISNPPLNHHGEPAPTLRLRPPISTIAPMTRIVLEKYKSSLQEVFFATKFSGYGENNT